MQQLTTRLTVLTVLSYDLNAQLGYLLSTETNVSVLTYQSVYATKFHPDVLWFQCKDYVK